MERHVTDFAILFVKGAAFQDVESLTVLLISIPADSDDLVFLYIHTNIITIYDSIKPILAFLQFHLLSFRLSASERRNLTSATQQVGYPFAIKIWISDK